MKHTPAFLAIITRPRLPSTLKLGPEDRESIDFADWLRVRTLEGRLHAVWMHVPNEGKRNRLVGALMRATGLLPGAPDFLLFNCTGAWAIEMKAGKGRTTESQDAFRDWCHRFGVPYAVARGADEARALVRKWRLVAEEAQSKQRAPPSI